MIAASEVVKESIVKAKVGEEPIVEAVAVGDVVEVEAIEESIVEYVVIEDVVEDKIRATEEFNVETTVAKESTLAAQIVEEPKVEIPESFAETEII